MKACVELRQLAEKHSIAPENLRWFMRNVGEIEPDSKIIRKLAKRPEAGTALLEHPAKVVDGGVI